MREIQIKPVTGKSDIKAFVELPYRLYASDPNWVPPLRNEIHSLITPGKNPWFEHGEAQLFLALRGDIVVGRISAQIDNIALSQPINQGMGPQTGNWGFFEAEDEPVAIALLTAAEDWLRAKGMNRMTGPMSFAMFDECGLLIDGHGHPPTVMMAYNNADYQTWLEAAGNKRVTDLYTYTIPIDVPFPPLVERIVKSGERNDRIIIRRVNKRHFKKEAELILGILNDAWAANWGFVPLTDAEISYAGKKLKPLVFEDLIRIAEVDGEPVAFMMTLPDLNEKLIELGGTLFPFNWAKLLWWLRAPKVRTMRVPLMGVIKKMQSTRMASQLAFMLVDQIRKDSVSNFGASQGEFGWVLDDNGPMRSVGEAINGKINKVYRIYEKSL
jgi:hypothetical protein